MAGPRAHRSAAPRRRRVRRRRRRARRPLVGRAAAAPDRGDAGACRRRSARRCRLAGARRACAPCSTPASSRLLESRRRRRGDARVPALPAADDACALEAERSIFFVEGEDAAAALDAESEDDVLALTPALDLEALIEDELLLALPLIPRHERLPGAVAAPVLDGRPRTRARRQPVRGARGAEAWLAPELRWSAGRCARRDRRRCYNARLFRDRLPARRGRGRATCRQRVSGESHGRPTEQEVAFQARHASRAQRARQAGHWRSSRPRAKRTCATTSARPASTAAARC